MTKDEQNELFHAEFDALGLFHAEFDALGAKLLEHVHDHNKAQSAYVVVGYNPVDCALVGNVCVPCMTRVLTAILANLAEEGITPDNECNDSHPGVMGRA